MLELQISRKIAEKGDYAEDLRVIVVNGLVDDTDFDH